MSNWLRDYYDDVDHMRLEPYLDRHSEDVVVRFGNNPPVTGRESVGAAIGHFWTMISGLRHRFREVHEAGDTTVLEADIDYTRLDGDVATVPCATVLHRTDAGLVDRVQIYIDLTPVFAPAGETAGTAH